MQRGPVCVCMYLRMYVWTPRGGTDETKPARGHRHEKRADDMGLAFLGLINSPVRYDTWDAD